MAATDPAGVPQLMTPDPGNPPNSIEKALTRKAPYKSDLHHATGTRLLLERAVLLVVIDSSENLENPEQPDSRPPELNKHRLR
jgi:hypothetical protein